MPIGTFPPATPGGSGTVTSVNITPGTGISASGGPITGAGSITVTNTAPDQVVSLTQGGTTTITGSYPNFTISSADQYAGTVTSVAALTLGISGTDLSSTVANGTTTPVITLNVPTASASNRGALSPTDWSTFNGKQTALVSGTNLKTVGGATLLGSGDVSTMTAGILPRDNAQTTTASPWAWSSDTYDQQSFSALANALTINADAGTPTNGEKTIFRFKDNGTPRTLTFTGGVSKGFRPIGVTLTASASNWTYTTTASKTVYFGCIYNGTDSRWDIVALSAEA